LGASYACGSFCGLFTLYAGFTLGFWYGGECIFGSAACPQSISTREYSAGIIINIFYALFLPAISLNQLTPCLEKIADGKAAASRIFSIIDRVPKIKSRPNATVSDHL
jgi:ATP-binding cassette subfamily B (MDR/TAP) protein 1